jgi:hypothetical protein
VIGNLSSICFRDRHSLFNVMPFFKCIFKDLLTNLNVRFCFFSKRESSKPPTYQTKLTSFEKNCDNVRRDPFSIQSCSSRYAPLYLCQCSFYKIFVKFRNSKKNVLKIVLFIVNINKDEKWFVIVFNSYLRPELLLPLCSTQLCQRSFDKMFVKFKNSKKKL